MQALDVQSIFPPEVLCGGVLDSLNDAVAGWVAVELQADNVEQPVNPGAIPLALFPRAQCCCHPDPPVCSVRVANTVTAPIPASQGPSGPSRANPHAAVPLADVTRNPSPPARRPTSLARKTQQPHPQVNVGGAPVIPCHAQAVVTRAQVRPTASTARNRSRTARGGLRASRIQRRLRPIRRRMPQRRRCTTRNRLRATDNGLRATGIGRRTARNALRAQQKAPRVELFTRRAGLRASRLGWAGWRARWHASPSGHCTVLTVPAGVAVVPAVLAAPWRAAAGRREKRADMPWRRLSKPEPSPTTRSRA